MQLMPQLLLLYLLYRSYPRHFCCSCICCTCLGNKYIITILSIAKKKMLEYDSEEFSLVSLYLNNKYDLIQVQCSYFLLSIKAIIQWDYQYIFLDTLTLPTYRNPWKLLLVVVIILRDTISSYYFLHPILV